ncbi:helix-turn-helix transcriptional regulator [Sphingobacterium spiritivorum]|uniref:helix-turn-helix transcriptional regulator n=1 Tax=Sphingobacterium spiritivorum TaxID=258 RepID=UPI003DA4AD51
MNIKNKIVTEIRKSNSLTQQEFADKIGMSRSAVAQIENGINNASESTIRSVLAAFNKPEKLIEELKRLASIDVDLIVDVNVDPNLKLVTKKNNEKDLSFNEGDFLVESHSTLLENKSILLTLCYVLDRFGNYDFSKEEIKDLKRIEEAMLLIFDIIYQKKNLDIKTKTLIKSILTTSLNMIDNYRTEINYKIGQILDFEDLLEPTELE